MDTEALENLKKLFSAYAGSFHMAAPEDRKNIALKVEHTGNVCRLARLISAGMSLAPEETLIAEAVSLLHDIGRFPQYAKWRTFRDGISVNHGALGADILRENGFLSSLSPAERGIISEAVKFHNAFKVPASLNPPEAALYLKLVRDADKLDIWRILLDYYEGREKGGLGPLGLPDMSAGCSPETVASVLRGEPASHAKAKSLDDFKLIQVSWVYDLNFAPSFGLLMEGRYIERITATLPRSPEIARASEAALRYASEKATSITKYRHSPA